MIFKITTILSTAALGVLAFCALQSLPDNEPRVQLFSLDDAVSVYTANGELLFRGDIVATPPGKLVIHIAVDGKIKLLNRKKTAIIDISPAYVIVVETPVCNAFNVCTVKR